MVEPKTKVMKLKSDIELARLAQSGDKCAEKVLLDRYQYLAKVKARSYFLSGAEPEDTVQEGMIGLYKAIRDFNEERDCSFSSFAILCITRQIITAVKFYARKKHNPLSSYQSLDDDVSDEILLDNLVSQSNGNGKTEDPLDLFICKEELDTVIAILQDKLSSLERSVFVEYLDGKSYQEIADKIGYGETKMVDNALCRIRVKVQHYLDSPECLEEELKKLKEAKTMGKYNGNMLFITTVCKNYDISRKQAGEIWNNYSQKEKDEWHAAARGTVPVPVFKVPNPKAEPTGSIQPEVKPKLVVNPEPEAEPEPLEPNKSVESSEPAPTYMPLQELISIIKNRPELFEKVRKLVLEGLECEAETLQQELLNVQEEINSLQ